MKQYFLALATFTGTIIGVGFFGLPYIAAKIGFYPIMLYIIVLTLISILTHYLYTEICLRTNGSHRLPGFAEIYLGREAKWISIFSTSVGLYGANLAYILVGGGFLANLLMPIFGGSIQLYIIIFFALGALLAFTGSKSIAQSELYSMIILFAALIFIVVLGLPKVDVSNLMNFDFSGINLLLPYGVILFSLSGMSVIPDIREILGSNEKKLKQIISGGIIISAITYTIFIFLTLGVCGVNTTQDALSGLKNSLGYNVLIAGFIVGILATFTSYIATALTIKKIFIYDLHISEIIAWFAACVVPLILILIGFNDFIKIVSFTGAVTLGIDSIMIFILFFKAKKIGQRTPEFTISIRQFIVYGLSIMFLSGVLLELYFLFN